MLRWWTCDNFILWCAFSVLFQFLLLLFFLINQALVSFRLYMDCYGKPCKTMYSSTPPPPPHPFHSTLVLVLFSFLAIIATIDSFSISTSSFLASLLKMVFYSHISVHKGLEFQGFAVNKCSQREKMLTQEENSEKFSGYRHKGHF